MPGGGTSLATIPADLPSDIPARLLDLTRLARRGGRVPTGVDRVELAYLDRLIVEPVPLFGLVRTSLGYVVLDRAGCAGFRDRVTGVLPWGAPDRLSRIARGSDAQTRVEADLRRLALARCLPISLGRMLAQQLPRGVSYLNVGHSNLTERMLVTIRQRLAGRIAVLIHDTIPLDYPQYQRPATKDRFAALLKRVGRHADLVIANSAVTAADIARHLAPQVPNMLVAHLGVTVATPATPRWPTGFDPARPVFAMVGTIEPRKNHALMLQVWDALLADPPPVMPQLVIAGSRGWENAAVFARLDALGPLAPHVFEMPGLPDTAVAGLLHAATALLFPSFAEGYGLPPIEAAALGTPVIAADLAAMRETLGDIPVYLNPLDPYPWVNQIKARITRPETGSETSVGAGSFAEKKQSLFSPPTWDMHFNAVLRRA